MRLHIGQDPILPLQYILGNMCAMLLDTATHSHFDRNHQNICLMLRPTGLQLTVILTIHLGLVQGMSINILPSATNRSKPNNYLFYNRIPKCGSSTAMKYMRHLSFNLSYAWIGEKLTTLHQIT